ncbi:MULTISPECIES: type IX secretion system outer membrane channel protein PorV [Chitinophagaceae]
MNCKHLFLGLVVVFGANIHKAQSQSSINIVNTSVPFLRVSPDPRAGAMGDAGLALSPDGNATFWNGAKTVFAQSPSQVSLNYTPWLKDVAPDVYLMTLGAYGKLNDNQAIYGGIRYFNLGQMTLTDANGQVLQNSRPREFSVEGGFAQKITDVFSAAATFRYINSNLASGAINGSVYKAGTAFSGDISLFYSDLDENGAGLTGALSLSNMGSKISYTNDPNSKQFLPANLGIGIANTWTLDELSKITATVNANHLLAPAYPITSGTMTHSDSLNVANYYSMGVFEGMSKSFSNKSYAASFGGEYSYNNQFFARAGYYWETKEAGNRKYFTAGVGIKYSAFDINFSYLAPSGSGLNRNPLSNTLRFGVIFDIAAFTNGSSDND